MFPEFSIFGVEALRALMVIVAIFLALKIRWSDNIKAKNFGQFIRLAKKYGCTRVYAEVEAERSIKGKFNFFAESSDGICIFFSEEVDLENIFGIHSKKYTPNEKVTKYGWEKLKEVKKNIPSVSFFVQRGMFRYETQEDYDNYMKI